MGELFGFDRSSAISGGKAAEVARAAQGWGQNERHYGRDDWAARVSIGVMVQDIRHAYRTLLRSAGFTIVVTATLALGIGASLTMFSLMRAVLWRPLPYPEPDRIVSIQVDARNVTNAGASTGEVRDLKLRSQSLELVSTFNSLDASLEYAGETEHVLAASISDDFLPLLGARVALGRTLDSRIDVSKEADNNAQALAIVISDAYWRKRFGGDARVIGRTVRVNNSDVQIVGVLAPGFRLFVSGDEEQMDIWLPSRLSASRQYRGAPIMARLRPCVTLARANAELQTLVAQFTREYPEAYRFNSDPEALRKGGGNVRFTAQRLHDQMTREARPALFLLAGAVVFVLLIACVNVANLMLARGSARQRELAIRQALGADRVRLIRQLLTESLVLALASGAIGLVCAKLGLAVIAHMSHSHLPLQSRVGIDGSVAAFALVLSVVTSVLFGMLPAWRLTSSGGSPRRTETAGGGTRGLQRTLVVAEVALSIIPLVCGGLMLRSFINLVHSPLGFEPANVVTARVPVSFKRFPHIEQRWLWLQEVMDGVRALPGVESVSAASPLPLSPGQERRRVGRADLPDALPILATEQFAAPGYLAVIGTPLLRGRDFTAADITASRAVTIVDERLAKRLWPNGAIGQHLAVWRSGWRDDLEVIGVTVAVRVTRVRDDNTPHFVMPYSLYPEMSLVIKTRETAERIGPGLRRAVDAAHGGWPAFDIRPMSAYVSDSIGDTRFMMLVLAAFAGASVVLAAVGLYGTLAYLTSQRTREFGIRLALGSSVRGIFAIVMREGIMLALAGAALGLVGGAAATRAIREQLYGVRPLDALTLAGVVTLVGIVALGAAAIPAWRAAGNDPQASLRSE